MTALLATRTAQDVEAAEFTFSAGDTLLNSSGVVSSLTATAGDNFDVINLPVGAVIVGGSVTTDTAFDTAGLDIKIGIAGSDAKYLTSADAAQGAGQIALVPTGFVHAQGENLRYTFTTDDAITVGKMTIRVQYIITGRADEVVPN